MTDPGTRPRKRPSSRANIPSGVSANLVSQTTLVSAFVYCSGSSTKSNASWADTPGTNVVPSPRTMTNLPDAGAILARAGARREPEPGPRHPDPVFYRRDRRGGAHGERPG